MQHKEATWMGFEPAKSSPVNVALVGFNLEFKIQYGFSGPEGLRSEMRGQSPLVSFDWLSRSLPSRECLAEEVPAQPSAAPKIFELLPARLPRLSIAEELLPTGSSKGDHRAHEVARRQARMSDGQRSGK